MTASPALCVIWVSRSRNLAVGMPDTSARNRFPAGRGTGGSRRVPGPAAERRAKSGSRSRPRGPRARGRWRSGLETAARMRPSRVLAGSPARHEGDRDRGAGRVPGRGERPGGEVPGVHVDRDHRIRPELLQVRGRSGCRLPARVQVPTPGDRVERDVVADRPGRGLRSDLITPVSEADRAGETVPAVRPVRQVPQRGGELDLQPALIRVEPDGLVSPGLVFLPVRGEEQALGLPPLPPLA